MTNGKAVAIVQWNCRGLGPNFKEVKHNMADFSPYIFCLQETFLKKSDSITFKGYSAYNRTNISHRDNKENGGGSMLIENGVSHTLLHLHTNLQAVAAQVTIHQTITVCSIYIPPRYKLRKDEIDQLTNQLPTPILLLGDFNAHSGLWGCVKYQSGRQNRCNHSRQD